MIPSSEIDLQVSLQLNKVNHTSFSLSLIFILYISKAYNYIILYEFLFKTFSQKKTV